MGTAIKHPVPDRVKPLFVIFDIWALWRSRMSVTMPGCQKLQMTALPVRHRMHRIGLPCGNSGCQWVNADHLIIDVIYLCVVILRC